MRNVRRLLAMAGPVEWKLYLVGGEDDVGTIWKACSHADITLTMVSMISTARPRLTYWQAMELATQATDSGLIVNLANDLLPGQDWLARGLRDYRQAFPGVTNYGLLGFNDGHHEVGHSPHFLIDRDLLTYLGGWPTWYDHNYGDTELCQRALGLNLYAKSPWATLFHDHVYFGADDDAVYQEGRASAARDQALYEQRRAAGWPTIEN